MMSKKERLSREEFNRFFSVGKRLHSSTFQLIYSPHTTSHTAIVVPKKVLPSAVKRNKLRRRVYDIIRSYNQTTTSKRVCILVAKQPSTTLTFPELKKEVITLVGRAGKVY